MLCWALAGFCASAGCSWLVNPTAQQCKLDSDCAARGAAFAGATCADNFCVLPPPSQDVAMESMLPGSWACVGNLKPAVPVKPQVQITVTVADLIHPEVSVSDSVVLRVCRKLDVKCLMPISATVHPDATGHAVFTVDGGFDGYVEVNPAVNPPVYIPTLIFTSSPVVDDYMYSTASLLSTMDLPILAQSTGGAVVDPALGAVFFRAADCNQTAASGMVGTLDQDDPETRRFFVINGVPTQTASATDTSGLGGFVNVPVGFRNVSGTRVADGLFIGSVSVLIRPSTFSYSSLAPQPL